MFVTRFFFFFFGIQLEKRVNDNRTVDGRKIYRTWKNINKMSQTQIGDSVCKLNMNKQDWVVCHITQRIISWMNQSCDVNVWSSSSSSSIGLKLLLLIFFPFEHVFVLNYALRTSNQITIKWCFSFTTIHGVNWYRCCNLGTIFIVIGIFFCLLPFIVGVFFSFMLAPGKKAHYRAVVALWLVNGQPLIYSYAIQISLNK